MENQAELVKKFTDVMADFTAYFGKHLPDDVQAKLEELRAEQTTDMAKIIYDAMFKDIALAKELDRPMCQDTGIPVVLMDANDLQRDQLGKSPDFPLTDAQIQDAMADNPSGQGDELTPFILIRPLN